MSLGKYGDCVGVDEMTRIRQRTAVDDEKMNLYWTYDVGPYT